MSSIDIFETFITERYVRNDWNLFVSRDQSSLSRAKILNQCEIPRSALYQNRKIVDRLRSIESELETSGVLKSEANTEDLLSRIETLKKIAIFTDTVEKQVLKLDAEIESIRSALIEFPLPR